MPEQKKNDPYDGLPKKRLEDGWYVVMPDGQLIRTSEYRRTKAICRYLLDQHVSGRDSQTG